MEILFLLKPLMLSHYLGFLLSSKSPLSIIELAIAIVDSAADLYSTPNTVFDLSLINLKSFPQTGRINLTSAINSPAILAVQ